MANLLSLKEPDLLCRKVMLLNKIIKPFMSNELASAPSRTTAYTGWDNATKEILVHDCYHLISGVIASSGNKRKIYAEQRYLMIGAISHNVWCIHIPLKKKLTTATSKKELKRALELSKKKAYHNKLNIGVITSTISGSTVISTHYSDIIPLLVGGITIIIPDAIKQYTKVVYIPTSFYSTDTGEDLINLADYTAAQLWS